jgi:hypothetical protein
MTEMAPLGNWEPAGGFNGHLHVVTLPEFASTDEPGADALLGASGEALIPQDGDVMVYGDGGAGKTTLSIDAAFHLAAGDDWLGIPVNRPLRLLLIENEGPRPLFRAKLRRKLEHWHGSPIDDRLLVLEAPWATVSFADEQSREALASAIRDHHTDIVIVGPVTRSGMDEAGTLQQVRDFMGLVGQARQLAERHVTFILIHHENKGGKVSGAWEGAGDTLLHVQAQGHGRTRVYIQKSRWSSAHHATTLNLIWTDGDGFEVEEKDELNDTTLAELITAYISDHPGSGWKAVEQATPGVNASRRRQVRDGLLQARQIVNVAKFDGSDVILDHCPERKQARLYQADDPTIQHLRPDPDAVRTQTASAWGAGNNTHLRPASRLIGDADVDAVAAPPENDEEMHWR